ncbi:TPA: hypothetical protein SMI57_000005 [Serratia liquefaciens]|nr:hypothetical protein [Serratia liquefaciens]
MIDHRLLSKQACRFLTALASRGFCRYIGASIESVTRAHMNPKPMFLGYGATNGQMLLINFFDLQHDAHILGTRMMPNFFFYLWRPRFMPAVEKNSEIPACKSLTLTQNPAPFRNRIPA